MIYPAKNIKWSGRDGVLAAVRHAPPEALIMHLSDSKGSVVNLDGLMTGPSEAIQLWCGPKKESTKVLEFLMPGYTVFYNTLYSYSYLYHAGSYVHLLIVVVIRCTARHD